MQRATHALAAASSSPKSACIARATPVDQHVRKRKPRRDPISRRGALSFPRSKARRLLTRPSSIPLVPPKGALAQGRDGQTPRTRTHQTKDTVSRRSATSTFSGEPDKLGQSDSSARRVG